MDIQKQLTFITTLIMMLFSLSVLSEPKQMAKVGYYDEAGNIKIVSDVFLDTFADGGDVEELRIHDIDGFIHVRRKGYDSEGVCRAESLQLVNKNGTPIVKGSDPLAGKSVYISSLFATKVVLCADDGCRYLKHVVLPGDPPLRRAACDITETSDEKCACHVDRGYGDEIIRDGLFCKSLWSVIVTDVPVWVEESSVSTIDD